MLIDHLPFIAAIALGLTLMVSGLSKLQDAKGFVLGVLEYEILPARLAILYGRVLPFLEVAIGIALMLGIWRSIAGIGALALLSSFLIAVTINIARGRRLDCHCFGSGNGERLGWMTVIRILVLIALAAVVGYERENEFFAPPPSDLVPLLLLSLGVFISVYLVTAFPTVYHIWRVKLDKDMIANSSRVSLRGLPPNERISESKSS